MNKEIKTESSMQERLEDYLMEIVADIEHDRWSGWQKYLHSKCIGREIPVDWWNRWERQMNTQYSNLSEEDKEKDRVEVRKCFPIFLSFIQSEIDRAVAKREKEIVEWLRNRCQINMNIYGTTKWNKDMEGLISLITKQ